MSLHFGYKRLCASRSASNLTLEDPVESLATNLNKISLSSSSEKEENDAVNEGPFSLAKQCDKVVILFADIQGYSEFTKQMSETALVAYLNRAYKPFIDFIKLEKTVKIKIVKLNGDCIMLNVEPNEAIPLAVQASAMVRVALKVSQHFMHNTDPLINFRFGIHVGPACQVNCTLPGAPVRLDLLGTEVNFASRLESSGVPNQVQISSELYDLVKASFVCARCEHSIKSFGKPITYFVTHRKASLPNSLSTSGLSPEQAKTPPLERRKSISSPTLGSSPKNE